MRLKKAKLERATWLGGRLVGVWLFGAVTFGCNTFDDPPERSGLGQGNPMLPTVTPAPNAPISMTTPPPATTTSGVLDLTSETSSSSVTASSTDGVALETTETIETTETTSDAPTLDAAPKDESDAGADAGGIREDSGVTQTTAAEGGGVDAAL